ncbi:MAG: bifunctional folylpolyglutamate synthase/dihydrofolate synthase, partial [Acidimicrobiia bacterium]|nr:bifunctional folylpolyglutamate synthase/dihydrofolate synthase [Acidimicrobiia bacterium]
MLKSPPSSWWTSCSPRPTRSDMNIGEALAWLDAHVNLESLGVPVDVDRRTTHPTLDRMFELTQLLGSPQIEYPLIHLTGTNGKTSAARIASALLVAHGLSVGATTSPNLERVNERITWNGEDIDDETLAELLTVIADVEPHLAAVPSYFEILTALAFRFFADVAVEAAVVEVGLGGRWDATNVADGRVVVVTNVSIDHVEYLGRTRAGIAAEKSGIVKPGAALVLGETDPELFPIFEAREPSELFLRDRDFGVVANDLALGGRLVSLFTPAARYDEVFLALHGAHQADNAVAAITAVECFLGRALDIDLVREVLGSVTSPGRLEVLGHDPLVLLDGAHNVAGARALAAALAEGFPSTPRTLVVGLLREKDPSEMLEALGVTAAARLVCCRPPSPRARPPEELADAAAELGMERDRIEVVDAVDDALARAFELTAASDQIVVTGSLYVVGAARSALRAAD